MRKTVVITGSTRGIGLGMARAFLARGCSMMISGRRLESVEVAVAELRAQYPDQSIYGFACDVRDPDALESLWRESMARFGRVDIWINNGAVTADPQRIVMIPPQQAEQIVQTNLLGVVYGSQVAARGMLLQGFGAIYNMEGMGSDGRSHAGLTFYGMTKYAGCYFTKDLAKEMANSPVIVGALRPGMVVTSMITKPYDGRPAEWKRVKRIFNIIADKVEVVTPWLVDQMLKNTKNGVHLSWSSSWRLLFRMMMQPFVHRNVFDEDPVT